MSKTVHRYFAGLLRSQEAWLNEMADAGYRLTATGISWYRFEECPPGAYRYCLEYVGNRSWTSFQDYDQFLRELGYRTFSKNLNLRWSSGKVEGRPWAEPGGRIATRATMLDRELLIVEKPNDGTPFTLHTTTEDRMQTLRQMQKPWLWSFGIFLACALLLRHWLWLIFVTFYAVPTLLYEIEIRKLKKEAAAKEW